MADVYCIRDWALHFEVAQNKSVKNWSWVALKVKHDGKGYRRLVASENGGALYGAWVLIVQVAAKCPVRGVLADLDGPLTAEDLSIKTGVNESLFEQALQVLSSERIGWLLVSPYESAMSALSLQDRTVQDTTEQDLTDKSAASSPPKGGCPPELKPWLEWWNRLRAEKLVPCGVDVESPSQAILKGWKRVTKSRELQDLLKDRDAIEREIRASKFVRDAGWFRLEKILGGTNRDGEFIVRKILEGSYRDERKNRSKHNSGATAGSGSGGKGRL